MRAILLVGPSSAGKSTICDVLAQVQGWKVISFDEAIPRLVHKSAEKTRAMLEESKLFAQLSSVMTEEEILTLSMRGILTISKQPCSISGHQFSDPALPGLDVVLTKAGFDDQTTKKLSDLLLQAAKMGDPIELVYDEIFSLENKDKTLIIDTVPPSGPIDTYLQRFETRAETFRQEHQDITLVTQKALIYCPPLYRLPHWRWIPNLPVYCLKGKHRKALL